MAAPKRDSFKAAEVCAIAEVQPYVLRTWEEEFPQLGRVPPGGPRVYKRRDIELVLRIKALVFGEGLTLAGARRRLEDGSEEADSPAAALMEEVLGAQARERIRFVRDGLERILQMLSAEPPRELMLVAPTPAAPRRGKSHGARAKARGAHVHEAERSAR